MKIAITGHRPNKLGNDYEMISPLMAKIKEKIIKLIMKADTETDEQITLISGMALGIDTLFALIAHDLKFPLICAIPCLYQDSKWTKSSQDLYHFIIETPINGKYPEIVFVTKEPYNNTCMQLRNQWMVDNCDLLIAVWNGSSGGTANCVKYAQFSKKPIIFIDPNKL